MCKASVDSKFIKNDFINIQNALKKNTEKYEYGWKVKITFTEFESQAKREASYNWWVESFFHTI